MYYYNVLPEAIFVVYIKKNSGDLPAKNICLHAKFKFGDVTVLAVQLFNKIKRKKKKKKTKNMKNMFVHCISRMLCRNTYIFVEFIPFFWYVFDIDVTRNGNNLKLKWK